MKFLSNDMIYNIVLMALNDIQNIEVIKENKEQKQITLIFNSIANANLGEAKFRKNVFDCINKYLIENNLIPNDYVRNLSLTINGDENIRTIGC